MTWSYYPDGKLKSRVGRRRAGRQAAWSWSTTPTLRTPPPRAPGPRATSPASRATTTATHAGGTGTDAFTWTAEHPAGRHVQVFVRYPQVTGAATDAKYTVTHGGGSTREDGQPGPDANTGTWVSLGIVHLHRGRRQQGHAVPDQRRARCVADAVKLVRDNAGETDNEKKDLHLRATTPTAT